MERKTKVKSWLQLLAKKEEEFSFVELFPRENQNRITSNHNRVRKPERENMTVELKYLHRQWKKNKKTWKLDELSVPVMKYGAKRKVKIRVEMKQLRPLGLIRELN